MRNEFLRNQHFLTRLRVTTFSRRPMVQRKTAETANFDTMTVGKRLRHRIKHRLDREIRILYLQLRKPRGKLDHQFRSGHASGPLTGFGRPAWLSTARPDWSCRSPPSCLP